MTLDQVCKQHILKVLDECKWNFLLTARMLGISRSTLFRKIGMYGFVKPANIPRTRSCFKLGDKINER